MVEGQKLVWKRCLCIPGKKWRSYEWRRNQRESESFVPLSFSQDFSPSSSSPDGRHVLYLLCIKQGSPITLSSAEHLPYICPIPHLFIVQIINTTESGQCLSLSSFLQISFFLHQKLLHITTYSTSSSSLLQDFLLTSLKTSVFIGKTRKFILWIPVTS